MIYTLRIVDKLHRYLTTISAVFPSNSYCFILPFPLLHCSIHVVFGHAIAGFELIREVEVQKTDSSHKPYADIRINNCGELVKRSKPAKESKGNRLYLVY